MHGVVFHEFLGALFGPGHEVLAQFHEFNVKLGCWNRIFQVEFHKTGNDMIN